MAFELITALAGDYLNMVGFGAAGTAATAGNLVLSKLLRSRVAAAREILVEEIKLGVKDSAEISPDDAAAITFRYMRAATEGTARLNLRLLAAVASGQTQAPAFYADDFLAMADALSGLRREEIIVLGVVQQYAKKREFKVERTGAFWLECLTTLKDKHGISADLADGYAAACLRSGFLRFIGGLMDMGHAYLPSDGLRLLDQLIDVENVRNRHEN